MNLLTVYFKSMYRWRIGTFHIIRYSKLKQNKIFITMQTTHFYFINGLSISDNNEYKSLTHWNGSNNWPGTKHLLMSKQ